MPKSLTNLQFCQRLVTVSATGADGRPVIVPWHRECLQRGWGELLTAMNPGEDPIVLTLCSSHYAEELTKTAPVADTPWCSHEEIKSWCGCGTVSVNR